VAVTAVDTEPSNVVLMAERNGLRPGHARIGNVRRALEIDASPQRKREREYARIDRGAGGDVSAAMENLHLSGFFLYSGICIATRVFTGNVQLAFLKLAIIAACQTCKSTFSSQTKKNPKKKVKSVPFHLRFITNNLGSVISSMA
jgi:hypothetical protein